MQLQSELKEVYKGCCHTEIKLAAGDDELMKIAEALAKQVYDAKALPANRINKKMVEAFATKYVAAINEGFKVIDYNTADSQMLERLTKDVYQFSAAKNYHQLKALAQAMLNDDGKLRTFSEFKLEAFKINGEHINQWLKTEYDTAVASAQMAGKWEQIQADKDLFPLLQFDAVQDDRTTDLCGGFADIIKPADDSFWSLYYPPNHFNCRSTVRQLTDGEITPDNKWSVPDNIPTMFKTNLAEKGLVFPPGHPYWKGLPDEIRNEGEKLIPKNGD